MALKEADVLQLHAPSGPSPEELAAAQQKLMVVQGVLAALAMVIGPRLLLLIGLMGALGIGAYSVYMGTLGPIAAAVCYDLFVVFPLVWLATRRH